jgi:hypothetical protein
MTPSPGAACYRCAAELGDLVISKHDSAERMSVCIVTKVSGNSVTRCHLSRRILRNAGKRLWLKYSGSPESLNRVRDFGWAVSSVEECDGGDVLVNFYEVGANGVTYPDDSLREFRTDGYALIIPKALHARLSALGVLPDCLRLPRPDFREQGNYGTNHNHRTNRHCLP